MATLLNNTDKRQFLDPISTIAKIILLHFYPEKTKIRICDNTVQIVENNYTELLMRNIYKDSRNDVCVLYPIFIRYIELYFLEKKSKVQNLNNIMNTQDIQLTQDELSFKYLKKLGDYCIVGLKKLQNTYEYDNVVFTLQYYILLLNNAIDDKYSYNLLPENLKDLVKNNLLDDSKVKKIWEDSHIVELAKTFGNCFDAKNKNDAILLKSNLLKIVNILEEHDDKFKKMLGIDTKL